MPLWVLPQSFNVNRWSILQTDSNALTWLARAFESMTIELQSLVPAGFQSEFIVLWTIKCQYGADWNSRWNRKRQPVDSSLMDANVWRGWLEEPGICSWKAKNFWILLTSSETPVTDFWASLHRIYQYPWSVIPVFHCESLELQLLASVTSALNLYACMDLLLNSDSTDKDSWEGLFCVNFDSSVCFQSICYYISPVWIMLNANLLCLIISDSMKWYSLSSFLFPRSSDFDDDNLQHFIKPTYVFEFVIYCLWWTSWISICTHFSVQPLF